jgi:hypothetical protein
MTSKLTRVLALVIVALACSTTQSPPEPESGPINVEGTYSHVATGLEFPEKIGPFQRVWVRRYDQEAYNVAGHYQLIGLRVMATVYHYPGTQDGSPLSSESFVQHYDQVKADIERAANVDFVDESPHSTTINGFRARGMRALYQAPSLRGINEPVDSTLYLFSIGPWYLKFRFSYPQHMRQEFAPLEDEFVASIQWPVPDRADLQL